MLGKLQLAWFFIATLVFTGPVVAEESEPFSTMRRKMVESQIAGRGIQDKRVLDALKKVPRHEFVLPPEKLLAYEDSPLPIGHGQTISQPYIVALMTELLQPQPEDRVYEVGTGSGYQAAILAELVQEVYSVEIVKPLHREAKARLERLGYRNIHLRLGDGTKGWPEAAPFDKMIVTAAGIRIPDALIAQLKEGGRMVMPVGQRQEQILVVGVKENNTLKTFESIPVRFVPLVGDGSEHPSNS